MLSTGAAAAASDTAKLELPDPVRERAERLGRDGAALPAYVYDLDGLAAHMAGIRAAIPSEVEIFYAVKANPDPAVLRAVARHADGLEVASGGELRPTAATVPAARLAFGGPGKTSAELAAAVRAGMYRCHVESLQELRLLGAAALAAGRPVEILLRVNLPAADGQPDSVLLEPRAALLMGGHAGPFGMDPTVLDHCAQWLSAGSQEAGRLRLRGLHAHLAGGLGARALLDTTARVLDFARPWCDRHGVRNPYCAGLALTARPGETLRVEPGRPLTAYCGWYITRVLDVKRSHGQAFAVVAGGTHHLRTPAAKGHDQPFVVLPVASWPHDRSRPAATAESVTIVGQLCTPKDVLARDVRVIGLRAGDLVAFGMAGACLCVEHLASRLPHASSARFPLCRHRRCSGYSR